MRCAPHRNLVNAIVDNVIERPYRVRPPRSSFHSLFLRRSSAAAEADTAKLDPEASAVSAPETAVQIAAIFGGQDFIECGGGGGQYGGPAERTRLIGQDPLVYAGAVEGVAAERQEAELVARLELGEADGAVTAAAAAVEVPRDGAEGEERERFEEIVGGDAEAGGNDVVRGGEGAAVALGHCSDEEVDGGRDYDSGSDDDDDYHNRGRRGGGSIGVAGAEQRRRRCESSGHSVREESRERERRIVEKGGVEVFIKVHSL